MRYLFLILITLSLIGCQQTEAPAPTPVAVSAATSTPEIERPKLTCLGDSLTEGLGVEPEEAYPAQLERKLREAGLEWEVINAGLAGETSSGARSRLGWVLKTNPKAVLLETGANDGLRGIDPALTEENIDAIITELKAKKVSVMLAGMKAPPNLGADYASKFEGLYPRLAEKHEIPLIPFFLEGVARDPKLNQDDGKHPTPEGYTIIVDNIFEDVRKWLEGIDTP